MGAHLLWGTVSPLANIARARRATALADGRVTVAVVFAGTVLSFAFSIFGGVARQIPFCISHSAAQTNPRCAGSIVIVFVFSATVSAGVCSSARAAREGTATRGLPRAKPKDWQKAQDIRKPENFPGPAEKANASQSRNCILPSASNAATVGKAISEKSPFVFSRSSISPLRSASAAEKTSPPDSSARMTGKLCTAQSPAFAFAQSAGAAQSAGGTAQFAKIVSGNVGERAQNKSALANARMREG